MNDQFIRSIVDEVLAKIHGTHDNVLNSIPIAVSARHVHLSEEHVAVLFGNGYQLNEKSPLSQPGQFSAHEQVTIVGPKKSIHHVRILGPARELTQVEISATDARTLGIHAPLRYSGDIKGTAGITIVGPKGSVYLQEGCIIAATHIHMSSKDAEKFHVVDGQLVNVRVHSARPIVYCNVKVRVSQRFKLEMHVDTDEGNAAMISANTFGEMVQEEHFHQLTPLSKKGMPNVSNVNAINKKLITEKDVIGWHEKEIIVSKKAIITALAYDQARKRGIKIVQQ